MSYMYFGWSDGLLAFLVVAVAFGELLVAAIFFYYLFFIL